MTERETASTTNGKESWMSVIAMSTVSVSAPRYPEATPTSAPIVTASRHPGDRDEE